MSEQLQPSSGDLEGALEHARRAAEIKKLEAALAEEHADDIAGTGQPEAEHRARGDEMLAKQESRMSNDNLLSIHEAKEKADVDRDVRQKYPHLFD